MFQTKVVEKIKTRILCSATFFFFVFCFCLFFPPKILPFMRCEKNIVQPDRSQMTILRMRIADYKHTLRMCNTYCFSTAKMVARTRLIVRLYYIAYLVEIWDGSDYCLPCKLSQNVPSYWWYLWTKLHGIISQETVITHERTVHTSYCLACDQHMLLEYLLLLFHRSGSHGGL